jgi:hypothetical protein
MAPVNDVTHNAFEYLNPIPEDPPGSNETPNGCANDSYASSVVLPLINEKLPPQQSVSAKVLNHLTGIYDFVGTLSNDLCTTGSISAQSARRVLDFGARSITTVAVGKATLALAGIAVAAGGGILAAGGILAGGALALIVAPPAAETLVNKVADFGVELLQKTKGWINQEREI